MVVEIAQNFFDMGYFDVKARDILKKGSDLNEEEEVNFLLKYIAHSQRIVLDAPNGELSMREMKNKIFNLIGSSGRVKESSGGYGSYGCTVSKDDLKAIYNFIIALPTDYFQSQLEE